MKIISWCCKDSLSDNTFLKPLDSIGYIFHKIISCIAGLIISEEKQWEKDAVLAVAFESEALTRLSAFHCVSTVQR